MARRYKRPGRKEFRFSLILGLFILALLMGAAGTVYFALSYSENRYLFWAHLIWTVFFAVTIYCWIDDDRYDRYERMMIPVLYGALFLFFIALFIGGLVINIPKIASGDNVLVTVTATVIAEASLGTVAFFTYKFFLKEYIDKLKHRN